METLANSGDETAGNVFGSHEWTPELHEIAGELPERRRLTQNRRAHC